MRTACCVVHCEGLTPQQAWSFKQEFAEGALKCRYQEGVASSAVMWLPGLKFTEVKIEAGPGRIPELIDLVKCAFVVISALYMVLYVADS